MMIQAIGELPGASTRTRLRATIGIQPQGVVLRSWQEEAPGGVPLAPATVVDLSEGA
jgi:hypothetical protein